MLVKRNIPGDPLLLFSFLLMKGGLFKMIGKFDSLK